MLQGHFDLSGDVMLKRQQEIGQTGKGLFAGGTEEAANLAPLFAFGSNRDAPAVAVSLNIATTVWADNGVVL